MVLFWKFLRETKLCNKLNTNLLLFIVEVLLYLCSILLLLNII